MGLVYKKVLTENALLGLWEIIESLEELLALVGPGVADGEKFAKMTTTKRKKESLAVLCLLEAMLKEPLKISHDQDGKPFLENKKFQISISHSVLYAAVYLDKHQAVGVDIQKVKPDIGGGMDYFLNEKEQLWVDKTDFILMNILWSAKESVYKYAGIKELDPRNQVVIEAFKPEQAGTITAMITNKNPKALSIHYEVFEDYILTRTL
jgi:4'-phosphopantetheinyl transferase